MEEQKFYNLTNPQKSIWYTEEVFKGTTINNICTSGIIYGNIDEIILKKAINNVVKQNDSFRLHMVLKNGSIKQYISNYKNFDIDVVYINDKSELKQIENEEAKYVFNTIDSDLFKFKIAIKKNVFACVILTINHLISDSWSMGIIIQQILKNYNSIKNNESTNEYAFTYADFISSENEYKKSIRFEKDRKYWNQVFETIPEQATIPSQNYKSNNLSKKAKRLSFKINENLTNKANIFCKENNFYMFSFLMGIYSIYIGAISNTEDFVIGTPILNRTNFKDKNTTGMFVNTIPVRVNNINSSSFYQLINSISKNMLSILRHQKYSYNSILDDIRLKNKNIPNLYNILISYQITKAFDEKYGNYETRWTFNNYCANDLDIHIYDINDTGSLSISYDYLIDKYKKEDIKNLHNRITHIISQVLNDSNILIKNIDIITEEEKKKIIYDFNNTNYNYPKDKTIISLFEEQVEKTPENIAIVFENKELTYKELNEKANSLANYLRNTQKVHRNDLIGIMLNRSLEMIIAILAVLKSGGAYIPIDPTYPKNRIDYMLTNSNAKILLTQNHLINKIDFINKIPIDLNNNNIYNLQNKNLEHINKSEDLSYVIYTSGSTGLPKGVMLNQKALSNLTYYCNNYIDYLKNPSYQSIVSITTISFDIFIFETLISLQKGLKLVIANEDEQNTPELLNNLIEKHNIKIIQSTPSRMQIFVNNIENMPALNNLKYIILAGEQLPLSLVRSLHNLSDPIIYNGYGPSETTIFSTLTRMNNDKITIGKPLYNTQIYILNNNQKPVPIGISGEIYISGDGVGKGYLNNSLLTSKSFIKNPFINNSIMYKTGDIGLFTNDGNIICLGRSDNQIKIRGLRVELGEIEDKIKDLPFVDSCVVVKKTDSMSHDFLCSYIVSNTKIDINTIRKHLERFLPKYMVPRYFLQLEQLPYTPNGKIDRKKLPDPELSKLHKKIILPRNAIDSKLISLLKILLKADFISIDDDFFDLGGDSLSAITLCSKIQNEFNVQLFVRDILENPKIQELSDIISKKNKTYKNIVIKPVPKKEYYSVSSAQKRIYFSSQMADANSTLYNIPGGVILDKEIDSNILEKNINSLIKRHESLRTFFEIQNEKVVQKILDNLDFKLEVIEKADYDNIDILFKKFVKPFDLSKAPLFRANLIKFTNGKCAIFVDMHHIISDGASLAIFTDELCKLYNGESLSKISITYKDFANFENNRLNTDLFKEEEKYWLKQFDNQIPVLNMPTNYPRPAIKSFEGKKEYSIIGADITKEIEQFCKNFSITPYMFLLSCYYILLSKYTSQDDIVVGTPTAGRDNVNVSNLIGMFVNTLALRNTINETLTFKEFVTNIKQNVLEAFKYQSYPFNELVHKLNINKDTSRNPLFDTMFIYQNNGYKELNFKNNTAKYYIPDTAISKFDFSLEAVPINDQISLTFEYDTSLFNKCFIQNMSNHYISIINSVLSNNEIRLSDICIISEEEKNRILFDFNNTDYKFSNMSLLDLFEFNAKNSPDKVAVIFENEKLTYSKLNEKANSLANFLLDKGVTNKDVIGILLNRSLDLIIAIYAVIKSGATYVLIDNSFPEERIQYILNDSKAKYCISNSNKNTNYINISDFDYSKYNNNNLKLKPTNNLCIIYTSGSTGKPKGVLLHKKGFTNLIFAFDKEMEISKYKNILGIATVSFDMFAVELFSSTLLGNTLILANEEQQKNPIEMSKLIKSNNVEFFVTTPSRVELLLSNECSNPLNEVKAFQLGGEEFTSKLYKKLIKHTNARIFNGYGPTEITACCTNKLVESENINIGRPISNVKCYICDKNLNLLPIGIVGEICIAGYGVSKGYINNNQATKKSFIKNPFGPGDLYKTGDLGKYNENGEIQYIGRIDNQVKIRGLRIELSEIENKINELPIINSCVVVKKTDTKQHDLLCAYFTANSKIENNYIRNYLEKYLPKYMIPNVFMQMETLPHTRSGKIDRNNLPEPQSQNSNKHIIKPKNDIEIKLIKILKSLLNIENISMDDDFFELGGDSLSAINLCTRIQSEFQMQLFVKDILEHSQIQELADTIRKNTNSSKQQIIKPIEKAEFYTTSSSQRRMYFSNQIAGTNSVVYNIPGGIIINGNVDVEKLENCLSVLINRHESLRTYFILNNENVVQKIVNKIDFKMDIIDNIEYGDISSIFKDFVKPFDLSKAPLFRAKFIKFTNGKNALFIDTHHIISDGTSMSIFIKELCNLYNGKTLPELNITYKDFANFENERLKNGLLKTAENYWIKQFQAEIPVLNMPTSYSRPAVKSYKGKKVYSLIDTLTTDKIEQTSKQLGITPYMLLLSCYYILLSKYTSQNDIVIGSPIVGRDVQEAYNIIGMFVNTLALRNNIDDNLFFKDFVLNIKDNVLEAYKYQTYPFDELVSKLNIKRDTSRSPLFDTMFIYQNKGYEKLNFGNVTTQYFAPDTSISKFDLSLEAVPTDDYINLSFEYSTDLFEDEYILNLSKHYLNILNSVLDNSNIKISDISMISENEKKRLVYDFNNTYVDYPKDKTITELFEEQVKKTPNNVAIVFNNHKLTYKELNEKANSLAHYLKTKEKICRNDLIGIMCNRSLEMIIAILAVLKSGAAYIPIDPTYPKDRIDYMLKSSNSKVLLTLKKLENNVEYTNKVFIDLQKNNIYENHKQNIELVNKPDDLAYVIFTSGSTGNPKGVMLKHSNIVNFIYGMMNEFKFSPEKSIASITTISFDIFVLESLMPLLNGLKVFIANEEQQTNVKLFNELCIKNNIDIIQTTPSRMQTFMLNTDCLDFIRNSTHILLGGEPFPKILLNNLKQITSAKIYNMYGPTETAVWSTLKDLTNTDIITIGKPIINTQVYILGNHLELLPVGIPGELYISGDGVSKGYLGNNDLTKKYFIQNPFIENTLMYKTGDLGMYNSNGEIVCLGRSDNQVKIRGLRIELSEIESFILKYANINKAVVLKQTINNRDFLFAYFVANKKISINNLKKYLSNFLPKYMVPSYFIALNDLPYTPNGKIDKKSLPLPTEILNINKEEYIAPKTEMQKQFVEIFEKVLSTKPVGINDNFFELGGDSLLAMNLNIELSKITNKISYQDIFRFPSVAELEEKVISNDNSLLFHKIENLSDNCVNILKNCAKKDKIQKYHPKSILLTGGTGYLGIHILEEFIKHEKGNVYCIVRNSPGVTARTRLYQKLNYYFGNKYNDLIDKRIFAITGNISEPGFGLNQTDLLNLANSVDIVINSAAVVSHFGNYSDFYKANVTSVKYLIDFCKSFNKKLYHVSTISVSGTDLDLSYPSNSKKNTIEFNESSLYVGQILDNVYTRSKFEAESYILSAINTGLDAYLLRMGHLTPRYKDGVFQENALDNALLSKISSFVKLGFVPDYLLNYLFEFTPVDCAANAIYKIITHPTKKNRIFHIFNHKNVVAKKILKIFEKKYYKLEILTESEFISKIKQMMHNEQDKDLLKNIIDDFDNDLHLDYNSNIKVKSDFTIKYLRKTLFRWPKISVRYLIRYINLIRKEI